MCTKLLRFLRPRKKRSYFPSGIKFTKLVFHFSSYARMDWFSMKALISEPIIFTMMNIAVISFVWSLPSNIYRAMRNLIQRTLRGYHLEKEKPQSFFSSSSILSSFEYSFYFATKEVFLLLELMKTTTRKKVLTEKVLKRTPRQLL